MWWAGSILLTNPDDAANELKYLSDENIIDDNANYVDNDFECLVAIDNTNFTKS